MQVSFFAENSGRWTIADQGIMLNGAADAVRPSHVQGNVTAAHCRAAAALKHA